MNLDGLAQELDRLYIFEISEYISRCDELKKQGFKIYRNSNGEHKVVLAGQGRSSGSAQSGNRTRRQPEQNSNETKKENIFIRIKNRVVRGIQTIKALIRFAKYLSDQNK